MSDTTETETETETNTDTTDEPSKAELHDRVKQLESTVEKLMPSRRDVLRMGAAGLAGAAGLSATSQSVDASVGSAGDIGDPNNRPDLFADTVDANTVINNSRPLARGIEAGDSVQTFVGDKVPVAADSYHTIFNVSNSVDVISGQVTGRGVVGIRVTFDSGSSKVIGGSRFQNAFLKAEDSGGDGISVFPIPFLKDVTKLEFANGQPSTEEYGFFVITT